jgi:hypothetical protein
VPGNRGGKLVPRGELSYRLAGLAMHEAQLRLFSIDAGRD